jgi:hypothetical protein
MSLIQAINEWSSKKMNERLAHRFGGIQACPWCRQIANQGAEWGFSEWERDPFIDVLTCGVCGGESLWRFEIGMIYIGPLEPPKPSHPAVPYYDIQAARLRR